MSFLNIKDAIYLGSIAFVAAILIWWHHDAVVEGENKRDIALAGAVQKQKDAIQAQQIQDQKDSQDALQALADELNSVRAAAPRESTMRLCGFARSPSPLPATGSATAGAQPTAPAPGALTTVSGGDSAGPDIGTAVYDIARMGAILGAYRQATVDWALKQNNTSH